MHEPVWTARQPCLDPLRFVGGVVVHDDVHVSPIGHPTVEFLETVEEFRRAVAFVALSSLRNRRRVSGREVLVQREASGDFGFRPHSTRVYQFSAMAFCCELWQSRCTERIR